MSIQPARSVSLPQGLTLVLVVALAACSGASSGPASGQASHLAIAPSVVPASILPATLAPTPTPTQVPVSPAPGTAAPAICATPCQVMLVEKLFQPRTIDIKAGTEVVWSNTACTGGCTVTLDDDSVDSGPLAIGATFKHTFRVPGTFGYHCQLMPNLMWGTINVTT